MTLRFACLSPLLLVCIACSDPAPADGTSGMGENSHQPSAQSDHMIAMEYRGRWAEIPAACLSHNTRRYEISAIQIDRADFSGRVESVNYADDLAEVRLNTAGGSVDFRMVLDDANTMRASYGQREEFILHRCR
ncbi:MAG: hypothetical protein WA957_12615 [Alteraurantiacibacter sp.]